MNIIKLFSFHGVSKRKEWWWGIVFTAVIMHFFCEIVYPDNATAQIIVLTIGQCILAPVTVRRLRDTDGAIWSVFIYFLCTIAALISIFILNSRTALTVIEPVAGILGLYIFFVAGFGKTYHVNR